MGRRRFIVLGLTVAILAAACSSPSTSPGPSASGGGPGHPLPSLGPLGPSLDALAERDERVWADGMAASGATTFLGPGLTTWLDEQRHAFVDAVLAEGGITANGRVASTDPRFGAGVGGQTALGGGGLSLVLAGAFLREFTSTYTPSRNGPSQDFSLPYSETQETTIDGRRASVQMTTTLNFNFSGAQVTGTVEITITTTIYDQAGRIVGTSTVKTTANVDMDVCPDIDGGLNAHFDTATDVTLTGVAGSSDGSYHLASSGVATGQVNDNAQLQGLRVTGDAETRVSGAGMRAVDAAVHVDVSAALGTAGNFGSVQLQESTIQEDVTRGEETATSEDITALDIEILGTGVIVATLLFEAAQAKWQNGYCLRIEATESTRTVARDEVVPFSAKVFHNFDGSELDQPIVATFRGVKSATPLDVPQDPPASITYTAGSQTDDAGTVMLKTTSKRGIATLDLTFTVASDLILRFEIDSKITATLLAGLGGGGIATVHGEFDLTKDRTGHWHGTGDLVSTTTPLQGGCNTVTVAGSGTYDWLVSDVVVGPGVTNIELSMDSGPISETPDIGTITFCPGGPSTSPTNTWENLFFVSHNKDYKSKGLLVLDWTIYADADTWLHGGPVAEATWTENCDGPHAAPNAALITDCTGTTTMRLRLVPPPAP